MSGWSAGFGAWFSIILVIAVAGLTAARVFAGRTMPTVANGEFSWTFITAAVSALARSSSCIRWLTYPQRRPRASPGAQFGTYIGLVIAIVQTVFGYLNLNAAGEKLPWQKHAALPDKT